MEPDPLFVSRRLNRTGIVIVIAAIVWGASLFISVADSPAGIRVSSDSGAAPVAPWVAILPSVVGIVLVLVLPVQSPRRPVSIDDPRPFTITTIGLVILAVAFPVAVAAVPLDGELYILVKLVLFIIVPGVLILVFRRSVRILWSKNGSRWWGPAIVIVVWTTLSQIAPWNPTFDFGGYDPVFVVVAATATALTAGVGEELFYRRWVQTRLEAAIGSWPGIIMTSLAFALMHLGSHGSGDLVVDIAQVIVVQGSFGLFLGIMWWRYRNLLAVIVIHIIANGWGVAAALAGR